MQARGLVIDRVVGDEGSAGREGRRRGLDGGEGGRQHVPRVRLLGRMGHCRGARLQAEAHNLSASRLATPDSNIQHRVGPLRTAGRAAPHGCCWRKNGGAGAPSECWHCMTWGGLDDVWSTRHRQRR